MKRILLIALFLAIGAAGPGLADEGRRLLYQPTTITEPGSYLLTRDLDVGDSSAITIDADGVVLDLGGRTITKSPGATGNSVSIAAGNTDVVVRNGRIVGGDRGVTYSSGVRGRFVIEDLEIRDVNLRGINLFGASDAVIRGCLIDGAGVYGVVVSGNGGEVNARIENNTIRNAGNGIYLWGLRGSIIHNNELETFGSATSGPLAGIYIGGQAAWEMGANRIIGNTLRDGLQNGIWITATVPGNTLRDNVIRDTDIAAIRIYSDGNRIVGNVTTGCASHGLAINGNRNLVERNLSEDNGGCGITFPSGAGHAYRDNMIRGNVTAVCGSATDAGGNVQ